MTLPHQPQASRLFALTQAPIVPGDLAESLRDPEAGGFATFEGWVRNHHEGRKVLRLRYEAYEALALKQGERIVREARERHNLTDACCVHRTGLLDPGEIAVWIGAAATHREAAFAACREILERVKSEVPIWKQEFFADGSIAWVDPSRNVSTEQ